MQMVAIFQARWRLQLGGLGGPPALWSRPTSLFHVQGEERRLQVRDPSLAAAHGEFGGDWFEAATGCSLGGRAMAHNGLKAMLIAF